MPLLLRPVQVTGRRHKSTASRMKRALNIQPHPSFLPSKAGDAATSGNMGGGHIIFNPPSSAPSVYNTPFKFLPKNDPRRRANLTTLFNSSTTISYSSASKPDRLPPILHPSEAHEGKRHHLTPDDIAEMRRLRAENPLVNSVAALARRYDCSHLFVLMCCQAPVEHKARVNESLEHVKSRWGPTRTRAREDRQRRRDMLFRGEL